MALLCSVLTSGLARAAATIPSWQTGQQLITVVPAEWNAKSATLQRFEKRRFGWRRVGPAIPVQLGKNGSAWGIGLHRGDAGVPEKMEGDGKAPAGLFSIGFAFGADATAETGLPYQPMDASDWCIDVPGSPYYNQIVDQNNVGAEAIKGSSEPMRRDLHLGDDLYRRGFLISHNLEGADRRGSCIFAHRWRAPDRPTAGCTAMAASDLDAVLRWLDATREPRFLLLPTPQYQALKRAWKLPRSLP
ncbi:L,D-transpeptidase family protein [Ahniella affigens]|nr:hypothetical protein [Ahniella affigens]